MKPGDLYSKHPKIALSIQTLTACALGYITHLIQQRWSQENYLLLHISIWWVLITAVLLRWAEWTRGRPVTPAEFARSQWSQQVRLNALCDGTAAWFRDAVLEDLTEELPTGGPLFRSICLRIPQRWRLDRIETSMELHAQLATFGRGKSPCLEIDFGEWAVGWRVSVTPFDNATRNDVWEFLMDLHRTLERTDGITSVRWYCDEMLQGGQMCASDYQLGTKSPIESTIERTTPDAAPNLPLQM